MQEKKFDLNDRLIHFAAHCITISECLPKTIAGNHIAGQLIRSGTAPALHYGEAQGAESRNDFIHKMKVALKELRETFNALKIIRLMGWYDSSKLDIPLNETNQLISIFVKSIETTRKNLAKEQEAKKNKQ